MQRLAAASDRQMHHGRPELCCIVLDRMAEDAELTTVAAVLRREMTDSLVMRDNLPDSTRILPDDAGSRRRCRQRAV